MMFESKANIDTGARFCSTDFVYIKQSNVRLKFSNQNKHYANMSMQYTAIFHGLKNDNFQVKIVIFFLFLHKNAYGYEYPQSMFKSKNKKIMYTPVNPSITT